MQIRILQNDNLSTLKKLISGYTGFTFNASRTHTLHQVLKNFSAEHSLATLKEAERLICADRDLMKRFCEALLVHETYFFREKELLHNLVARLEKNRSGEGDGGLPVLVWSAGCSTGEEAFSLALMLLESTIGERFRIIATDISTSALNQARLGQYSEWSLRGVCAAQKEKYFEKTMQSYHLKSASAKERVTFEKANLIGGSRLSGEWSQLDAIVCRNVLIYFEKNSIEQVTRMFFDQLKPGGVLICGASDPPLAGFAEFDVEYRNCGLVYTKPVVRKRTINQGARSSGRYYSRAPVLTGARCSGAGLRLSPKRNSSDPGEAPTASPGLRDRSLNAGGNNTWISNSWGSSSLRLETAEDSSEECRTTALNAASLYKDGRWQDVVALLEPQPKACLNLLVRSLLNLGRRKAAVSVAQAACRSDPLDYLNHLLLALALMSESKHREAVPVLEKAVFLNRNCVTAHFLIGAASLCIGQKKQAERSMKNALNLLDSLAEDAEIPLAEEQTPSEYAACIKRYLQMIQT